MMSFLGLTFCWPDADMDAAGLDWGSSLPRSDMFVNATESAGVYAGSNKEKTDSECTGADSSKHDVSGVGLEVFSIVLVASETFDESVIVNHIRTMNSVLCSYR